MKSPQGTNAATRWFIVVIMIIVSILLPGERSYAEEPSTEPATLTVDNKSFRQLVVGACEADIALKEIDRNVEYTNLEWEAMMGHCIRAVVGDVVLEVHK